MLQCPVYDLDHNVEFNGVYQSMTKKAAITLQVRYHFGGHYCQRRRTVYSQVTCWTSIQKILSFTVCLGSVSFMIGFKTKTPTPEIKDQVMADNTALPGAPFPSGSLGNQ